MGQEYNIRLTPADRERAAIIGSIVARESTDRVVWGLDELDGELADYRIEFLGQVIVQAAEELGAFFGGGHLPNEPRAHAEWMLLGEDSAWPESIYGGVPPIWVWLKRAFYNRFPA